MQNEYLVQFVCKKDGQIHIDTVESGSECESIVDLTLEDLSPMIGKVINRENTVEVTKSPQDPDVFLSRSQA